MPKPEILIAPSLLAADPAAYGREMAAVAAGGADWLHLDIMDGSFVPPITFGADLVAAAKSNCQLPLDTHLMINAPERHIETFAAAGSAVITVHQEGNPHLHRLLGAIRRLKVKAGVVINPGTPAQQIFAVLDLCDLVLVMTVNPGWGGQPFIESCLPKITAIRSEADRRGLDLCIEVDGGINEDTGRRCAAAGANVLVAGSYIFGATDRGQAIKTLRTAAETCA